MSPRPRFPIAAVALLLLALSGCSASAPADDPSPTSADATRSATPAAGATDGSESVQSPPDLTFDAGSELDDTLYAQWGDPFFGDEDFTASSPDDGNGNWAYTEVATGCEVRFWQGDTSSLPSHGDDLAMSDELLATWLSTDVARVSSAADDGEVGYLPGPGTVQTRVVSGSTGSDETFTVQGRALSAIDAGLIVHLSCPSGDELVTLSTSLEDRLTVVVGPRP